MNTDRFRFRAWHENGEMVYFDNEKVARDQYQAECFMDLFAGKFGDVMMQCTGMGDSAGNLIFNGDVLTDGDNHYLVSERAGCCVAVHPPNHRAEEEGECVLLCELLNPEDMPMVIGNIHENPELLK